MPFDLHGGVDSYGLEDVDQDILHSIMHSGAEDILLGGQGGTGIGRAVAGGAKYVNRGSLSGSTGFPVGELGSLDAPPADSSLRRYVAPPPHPRGGKRRRGSCRYLKLVAREPMESEEAEAGVLAAARACRVRTQSRDTEDGTVRQARHRAPSS
jgi:hypothetical protein